MGVYKKKQNKTKQKAKKQANKHTNSVVAWP